MRKIFLMLLTVLLSLGLSAWGQIPDPNIISFGDSPQVSNCGSGATLCSTNGTLGYTGSTFTVPFNLSTINSWFQVDGTTALPGQTNVQTANAGEFEVVNDTGAALTTFSLTIVDNFTLSTPGNQAGDCGAATVPCQNFQIHGGNSSTFFPGTATTALSGPTFHLCTQGGAPGCSDGGGGAAADFSPNTVTYTWGGINIGAGDDFGIDFASWNNAADTVAVPEPASMALLGTALLGAYGLLRRKLLA